MAGVTGLTQLAVEMVCLNMREADRIEVYGMSAHDNPVRFALETMEMALFGRGAVGWHAGRPHGVMVLAERWPGVWDVAAYGTDQWHDVAPALVRWAHRQVRELLQLGLMRRLEACSRVGHTDAELFLLRLGAVKEGPPMRGYGKDGAAYQRFVWLKETRNYVLGSEDADAERGTDTADAARCDIRRAGQARRRGRRHSGQEVVDHGAAWGGPGRRHEDKARRRVKWVIRHE